MSNNATQFFNSVKNDNEEILWTDTPIFMPFVLPYFLLGLPFLIISIIILIVFNTIFSNAPDDIKIFSFIFYAFGSLFILVGLGICFGRIFAFSNTAFAYTQYRVLIRGGFWGTDFISIDYDKITNMEVNVNPIENMSSTGSILFYSGKTRSTKHGTVAAHDAFSAIKNPYEVFKKLKQISLDVKTDIHYPNALRPDNNPGYNTNYNPRD